MKNVFLVLVMLGWCITVCGLVINIVTEDFPKYSYMEEGVLKGLSTEVVQAVIKEINDPKLEVHYYVMEWNKAMEFALANENVLIYSIGRNHQREDQFNWIGVVAPYDVWLFALKLREDIKIKDIEDAKKFKIGTTYEDAREQYLLRKGFMRKQQLIEAKTYLDNMKQLLRGDVDLIALPEIVANAEQSKLVADSNQLQKVYQLKELSSNGLYMALSKSTSEQICSKFRRALHMIKRNGTYDKIIEKYKLNP